MTKITIPYVLSIHMEKYAGQDELKSLVVEMILDEISDILETGDTERFIL